MALGIREVHAFPFVLDETLCLYGDVSLEEAPWPQFLQEQGIPALAGIPLSASFPLFNIFVGEVN